MAIYSSSRDFQAVAKRRLPRFLYDYIEGGSYGEQTLYRNIEDLSALALRQRVLKDVSVTDMGTTLFGQPLPMPVALGPVGITGMYARRGEVQVARAAAKAGIPSCLSTVSICAIDEVAHVNPNAFWFQLYVIKDRAFMRDLLATAKAAGARALVFTVDMAVPGARHRDAHSGLSGPGAAARRILQALGKPHWAWDVGVRGRPHTLGNLKPVLGRKSGLDDYMGWLGANFDPSITWADLGWIRAAWDGPLILKGILDPEDAREAVAMGADGIVVSNHGGRQLDGALSTARALPAVADAVGGKLTVLVDGGIRSGLDVLRMIALGADGVMLGRAWVYALAAAGEAGVAQLLEMIRRELAVAMALTGTQNLKQADPSLLA